jgi:Phosphoesterase family
MENVINRKYIWRQISSRRAVVVLASKTPFIRCVPWRSNESTQIAFDCIGRACDRNHKHFPCRWRTLSDRRGYWDSGFFQPIDFFGDGPRIPLIAVSKYSRGGKVVHTYGDHASIVKFIERNWGLKPLTKRSRDNLPNPTHQHDAYVPDNMPAIGDLFDMFQFERKADD